MAHILLTVSPIKGITLSPGLFTVSTINSGLHILILIPILGGGPGSKHIPTISKLTQESI